MSKLVKKVGNKKFYEIDGIRAGGIIPYFIKENKVFLLINKEFRKDGLVYNITGGKVDEQDKIIEDTQIREFNEETGFLISKKIENFKNEISSIKFFFEKPKYMLSLININAEKDWLDTDRLKRKAKEDAGFLQKIKDDFFMKNSKREYDIANAGFNDGITSMEQQGNKFKKCLLLKSN